MTRRAGQRERRFVDEDDASGKARLCRLYVTHQKEYLVFQDACVGIRDRRNGRWLPVLPNRVVGSVVAGQDDASVVSGLPPRIGERLCIQVKGQRVLSSVVLSVERAALPRTRSDF